MFRLFMLLWIIASIGYAEEDRQVCTPDLGQLLRIDPEQIALHGVINYYGAAKYDFGYDEATLPSIWAVDKKLLGKHRARENFNNVCVFAEHCMPMHCQIYSAIFVDMITHMQRYIVTNSYNIREFCRYFAKYYHAGGRGRTRYQRAKNNKKYALDIKIIWYQEMRKSKTYWNDPIMLNLHNQQILTVALLYAADVSFVKTLCRKENGKKKWGGIMGHESPVNFEVYGNPCLPEECQDYATGTRAYLIALQNFILKQPWYRKQFFKRYAVYRKLNVNHAKYVKMILGAREERIELLKARKKLDGYKPIIIEGDLERKIK